MTLYTTGVLYTRVQDVYPAISLNTEGTEWTNVVQRYTHTLHPGSIKTVVFLLEILEKTE